MARKTQKKTYKEFMSWLEGVECMQDRDWTPNPSQWKMIRQALNHMIPEEKIVEVETEVPTQPTHPPLNGEHLRVITPPTSAFEPPAGIIQTPAPMGAPTQPAPPQQRLMPSGLQEVPSVAPGVPAATVTKKDQVLDTSDGKYESEFM